jgi:hypothetical protein
VSCALSNDFLNSSNRQGRSTLDHLVRFETFIRNAFAKKEHAVSIFFDLEKAYDTTWKYGILKDLFILTPGLDGVLFYYKSAFQEFLSWRI